LSDEPSLKDYHLLPSVRGDLLFRLGRFNAARDAFLQAASMTRNERERRLLESRAGACARE
jgi:predicted RNA polymerase sigma factor